MSGTGFMIAETATFAMACFMGIWGAKRYRDIVNPLVVFAIFDIGVLTVLSALSVIATSVNNDDLEADITYVLLLAMLYMSGFFLVFLPRWFRFPRRLFSLMSSLVGMKGKIAARYGWMNHLFLIMLAFAFFILLALFSGAGSLWITNPRNAYLGFRSGVGYLYMLVQWTFMGVFIYYLLAKRPGIIRLLAGCFLYSLIVYFTGSKYNVLAGWVLAGVYLNCFVKRLSAAAILGGSLGLLGALVLLMLLHGSYNDLFSTMYYFKDYTNTTALFLKSSDVFNLQWGYGLLSDLWFYVPRALYPDKPYEYGITLIHQKLFPGAAALGATPGILPWALGYLDFGVAGVFIWGVFSGIIRRGAYEFFLQNRSNAFAFILMLQLSIWPVFIYATLPLSIIIGVLFAFFMRKRVVLIPSSYRHQTTV